MRHQPLRGKFGTGFYYGGLPERQVLQGSGSNVYNMPKYVSLTGSIPLYKLHGSLNWSREPEGIILYQDTRPAFRRGGSAAIIPPVTEKEMPDWLSNVWKGAEAELSKSTTWIVCGYSLPTYDLAIKELFERAGKIVEKIYVLDPYSNGLTSRWSHVAPRATIQALPGLPAGTQELALCEQ